MLKRFPLLLLALLLSACTQPKGIVVASMDSTEQRLLGEIAAQHLEKRLQGVEIRRQFGTGDTPIQYQALLSGQIDLYPEYAGAVVAEILGEAVDSNPEVVFERARAQMAQRAKALLLNPLGFDARFVAVTGAAVEPGIKTLSQAAEGSKKWTPAVSFEYLSRTDSLPHFNAYRLPLNAAPKPLQPAQLFAAMMRGEADLVMVPRTDSHLTNATWRMIEDDRGRHPPQQAALLVRDESIRARPELKTALEELSGKISDETMRRLNAEVDLKERSVPEVAREFLSSIGL